MAEEKKKPAKRGRPAKKHTHKEETAASAARRRYRQKQLAIGNPTDHDIARAFAEEISHRYVQALAIRTPYSMIDSTLRSIMEGAASELQRQRPGAKLDFKKRVGAYLREIYES
jgi:hypothetical protein